MVRKGAIAEIFSEALHHGDPDRYFIGYLDFDKIKEITLTEFLRISENFQVIPATRIIYIKNEDKAIYSKLINKKDPNVI